MDCSIKTPSLKQKRRSSIFKPHNADQQLQLNSSCDYPKNYKELLQDETNQWRSTIQTLKQEYIDLKIKTLESREIDIEKEALKKDFDLGLLDHTLYYEYLQSVQNVYKKFECLLDKKEQQKISKYNMLQIKDL